MSVTSRKFFSFYSRKYEKLPSIVIHTCYKITKRKPTHTTILLKRGPHIWLCLFMFRPVMLKQLNCFTSIHMFHCLGGPEIKHPTTVTELPGSIPGSGKAFYVCFIVLLYFTFLCQNTLFLIKFCNSFLQGQIIHILLGHTLRNLYLICTIHLTQKLSAPLSVSCHGVRKVFV